MIRIPQQFPWKQTNRSDIYGSLQGTFNVDFNTNLGKLRATRTIKTTDTSSNANLTGAPVGFRYFDTKVWTVAGSRVHDNSGILRVPFGVNSDTNYPSTCTSTQSDIEVFNGYLYVTSTGNLHRKTANASGTGTWTSNGTGFSGGTYTHMMCVYGDRLYMTDLGTKIYSMDTSDTIATSSSNTISFTDTSLIITFIRAARNRIWIGTVNKNGGKASIHEWDGSSSIVTTSYRLESSGALACVIKDDLPYIIDTNGKLLRFNAGTFQEIARLPIKNSLFLTNSLSETNNRFIHPNGMTISDGKINLLINNVVSDGLSSTPEFMSSGVWEYDGEIGLYHKYSLSYTPIGTTTITDFGQFKVSSVGGLSELKLLDNSQLANGNLLIGATIYTDSSTTTSGVFINDTIQTTSGTKYACSFVTSKFTSYSSTDTWVKSYIRHKQLTTSDNKIVMKYRTVETDPTEISITWDNSTSTFKTSTDLTNYVGYEVEVVQGTGSGMCAHITSVTNFGSTYFVNLDETFTGVTTGTAKARLQNWTKIPTTITSQITQLSELPIAQDASWMQFKVFMLGTIKDEIEEFIVINKENKKFI